MTSKRTWLGLGIAFVVATLLFSTLAPSETHAQTPPAPAAPKATATATAPPTPAAPAAPKATGSATTPTPAKTGNAGLGGTTGTAMALVLMMGIAAAALVAGARTATRER